MPITYVGVGTAKSSSGGSTGSLTPTLPSGLQVGDLVLIYCTGRGINYVFTSPNYTQKWSLDHASSAVNTIVLLYKTYAAGDADPVVSWTGGATNATVVMQVCAFRGVHPTPFDVQGATSSCASQQNIGAITGITTGASGKCVIVFGHKAGDWTSVATLSGDGLTWNEIGEPDSTSGTDAGMVWDYAISASGEITIAAKTFTVTGGEAQYGMGVMQSLNEAAPSPPTFGKTTIGASSAGKETNYMHGCKFALTEAGDVTKITAYIGKEAASGGVRAVIYDDNAGNPNNLKAVSAEVTIPFAPPSWVDFVLSVSLVAGVYHLCLWNSPTGGDLAWSYDAGATNQAFGAANTYHATNPPADPCNSPEWREDREFSIYATYIPAVTGWRELQYLTEPPTPGAFNKLKYASEPPVPAAWNKLLYEGE